MIVCSRSALTLFSLSVCISTDHGEGQVFLHSVMDGALDLFFGVSFLSFLFDCMIILPFCPGDSSSVRVNDHPA